MIRLVLILLVISLQVNSQTFSAKEFYAYLLECKVEHPKIVYNQACHETGWFQSKAFCQHNNLFGLVINGEYAHFAHWKECVRYYALYQRNRLRKGEDYYTFLVRIRYAEDSLYIHKLRKIKFKL